MKLKELINENWLTDEEGKTLTKEDKKQFLETVSNYKLFGKSIYREEDLKEISEKIKDIIETTHHVAMNENEDWFDKVTIGRHMKQLKESYKIFEKTAKDISVLQQRLESSYEDIGLTLSKYFDINEETLNEEDSKYQEFFRKAMAKFGVKSPSELSDDKKKEFYNYVDANWDADKETD